MGSAALSLLVGAAVAVAIWATLDLVFAEERRVAKRLKSLSDLERRSVSELEPLSLPFAQRVLRPVGRSLRGFTRTLMPKGYRARLQALSQTAGFPYGVDGDAMVAIKLTAMAFGAVIAFVFALSAGYGLAGIALAVIITSVVTSLLPDVWLSGRVHERQDRLRRELPDMLDMLTIAIEAGLGFDAAVSKYVQKRSGPLAEEFMTALREIQAGLPRRDALRNLGERCDVPELSAFVMAMVQADVFGVSVGKVLRTQSRELRVKRRQRAEEIAQKAPAKMVFPLVLLILPATLIVLMAPAVLTIGRMLGAVD